MVKKDKHTADAPRSSQDGAAHFFWLHVAPQVAIAVATTVYALVAFFQWRVMQHSFETTEQARVVFAGISHLALTPNRPSHVLAALENVGRLPASDVVNAGLSTTVVQGNELPDPQVYPPHLAGSRFVLAPGR